MAHSFHNRTGRNCAQPTLQFTGAFPAHLFPVWRSLKPLPGKLKPRLRTKAQQMYLPQVTGRSHRVTIRSRHGKPEPPSVWNEPPLFSVVREPLILCRLVQACELMGSMELNRSETLCQVFVRQSVARTSARER